MSDGFFLLKTIKFNLREFKSRLVLHNETETTGYLLNEPVVFIRMDQWCVQGLTSGSVQNKRPEVSIIP